MDNTLIIIPAHNEESTIESVIADLHYNGCKNILLVDDCSTDKTPDLAKKCGVNVMSLPYNLGAWKATQAGLRYASKNGYCGVVTFDADQQHIASQINILFKHQKNTKKDLTIGSCVSRGSFARRLAWRLFRKLSGVNVQDLTSGFRLYNRNAIEVLSQKEATLIEYQDVGVLLLLKTFNISKSEVDVEMKERTAGISRIFYSWWAVAYYMGYTTVLCLSKLAKSNKLLSTSE